MRRDGAHHDDARSARLARRRRRGAPRLDHQHGTRTREIEVTSYAELVLAPARPTTPPTRPSPSCSSRPNSCPSSARCWRRAGAARPTEPEVWAAHLAVVEGETVGDVQFETDRARFLGRGQTHAHARSRSSKAGRCPTPPAPCSIPIFSLRRRVRMPPGATARVAFWTMVAPTRDEVARSGRQASRCRRLRTRRDAGLDPGAGAAAPSRHRRRRSASVPAARQPRALFRSRRCGRLADVLRRSAAGRRAVGARHLRRPADRAGADRRGRRSRHRARSCCGPTNIGG